MALTDNEREKIREEEIARSLIRKELRRKQRPVLLTIAAVWTLALTALALVFT
ncbi:MAG: hypothetical protein M3P13_06485 [Acidobacteriota bacterium]|nr:hypothetical protein [Acidobacteriota bacterium]